ncbi:hypothetical protein D9756_010076 [Leucocoprinus leucothites]|uniref:Aldehyde dehydrogenase domain-containing protein n=1 Tax=Leucocoprinus leucothites TaxID=201217 RepID=A0A8H5CTQ8_9AGAR|nr:hypothetical protein D9756_010076 [Leucoagaricus leucothites]
MSSGRVLCAVAGGTNKDVDIAVSAAQKAFKTTWGLKVPGAERGKLLSKLVELLEKHQDELAALEALNVGKSYLTARAADLGSTIKTFRYYAGWADKIHGKTIEGAIVPWNFPLHMISWKIAPALACGNTVVLKPSEITPLSALLLIDLIDQAGFPPGVINVVSGYGNTVGAAIAAHPRIAKVAFTGSTLTGRRIMKASAESNLKAVTLELGGKSPTIIFDDANLEQAIKWASMGIFFNMGQVCVAGSRIYVQEGIYDKFLPGFSQAAEYLTKSTGNPFEPATRHGPQVSQVQFDRVMGYIESGKAEGAKIHMGGERHGELGYFIKPTIFVDAKPNMKIMQEEIFGPVCSIVKFKTEEEVTEWANDTSYGLSANILTENVSRAIRMANNLEAGSVFVNSAHDMDIGVPFGGYKQSGIGREAGEYALETYTQVKAVHINIGQKL